MSCKRHIYLLFIPLFSFFLKVNLEARYGGEPLVQHLFANGSTAFKSNLGKIVVYFEEFDHQSIQESAAYTVSISKKIVYYRP